MQGFQQKDGKSGKLIDALVICFDNRFNVATIPLWEKLKEPYFFQIFIVKKFRLQASVS